jgi:hypothetical protein
MLPRIAQGDANKVWIIPSEIGRALEGLGSTFSSIQGVPHDTKSPTDKVDFGPPVGGAEGDDMPRESVSAAQEAVNRALAEAEEAARHTRRAAPNGDNNGGDSRGEGDGAQEPPRP